MQPLSVIKHMYKYIDPLHCCANFLDKYEETKSPQP